MAEAAAAIPAPPSAAPEAAITPPAPEPKGAEPAAPHEQGSGKQPAPPEKAKEPQRPLRDKIKYNGKEEELDWDEIKRRASYASAAEERFQEGAKAKRFVEDWKGKAKTDFIQALMDPELGLTKEQIRTRFEQWYKQEVIDPEAMTPEQRELAEHRKDKASREKAEADAKAASAQKEKQEADDKQTEYWRGELTKSMIDAADRAGLPNTEETIRRMAYFQKLNMKKGFDAPMDYIAAQTLKSYQREQTSGLKKILAEEDVQKAFDAFSKYYGEDVASQLLNKLRKYDLARLTGNPGRAGAGNEGTGEPAEAKAAAVGGGRRGGKKSFADVARYFDSL